MSEDDPEDLEFGSANQFVEDAIALYKHEDDRVDIMRVSMAQAVHKHVLLHVDRKVDNHGMKPDGTIQAETLFNGFDPVIAFTEVKNEVGLGKCDPLAQAMSDYVSVISMSNVCGLYCYLDLC